MSDPRAPLAAGGVLVKPLRGTLRKRVAVPNVIAHHARARQETHPSSGKRARVQKCSLLLLGLK